MKDLRKEIENEIPYAPKKDIDAVETICNTHADELSVGFAYFIIENLKKYVYSPDFALDDGKLPCGFKEVCPPEQLLQIYKDLLTKK